MNRQKVFTVSLVIFMGLVCQTALGTQTSPINTIPEEKVQKLYDHLQLLITELHNFSVFKPWHRKVSAILGDMQYYRPGFSQEELNALKPLNDGLVEIIKYAQEKNFKLIYSGFTYLSPLTRQQMHKYYTNVLDYRLKKYFLDKTDFNITIDADWSVALSRLAGFFKGKKKDYSNEKNRIDQRPFFRGYYQRQLIINIVKDWLDVLLQYQALQKSIHIKLDKHPYESNINSFLMLGEQAMKSPEIKFESFFNIVTNKLNNARNTAMQRAGAATVIATKEAERQEEYMPRKPSINSQRWVAGLPPSSTENKTTRVG